MIDNAKHPNSAARNLAVQFLYQCECEKLFYFSDSHYDYFADSFEIDQKIRHQVKSFVSGTLDNLNGIDSSVSKVSENWSLERMPTTDRCVIRLATFEMFHTKTPKKVILDEAIELAKLYGTKSSGSFVNGVLDKLTLPN